jgi:long-chain acyl-CoA synthetase
VVVNVSEYLRRTAEAAPDRIAIVGVGENRRELTYSDLDTAADSIARALTGRGLIAGAPVGLVMANRVDLPIAYYGIVRGGMVAVPLNPRSTPDEISRRLTDAKVKLVLCDATGASAVRQAVAGHGCDVVVDGIEPEGAETSFDDFIGEAPDVAPAASRDPESLAAILYTSGSSGQPRGVMLSHRALIANIEQAAAVEPPLVISDDVVLGLLPMFHIYGLNAVLGFAVRAGARIVMVDGFDPAGLLEMIRAEGITNLPLAPPVVAAWAGRADLRAAMAGVRVVVSGASPLDPGLAAEFESSAGRPVDQGYGMTEAAPVIATTLASHEPGQPPKTASVGRPLPGVEVRILDTHGDVAAPGDVGEISVRGDNLFSGHWPAGPDGRGSEGPDADGWYATGDLGFLDDDGDLTIVDRLKDLVIVSGFNVYPSEVEDVIVGVDGVAEAAVVGVPDEATGEAVLAFVVPKDPKANEDELRESIYGVCRARLARFKQPTNVVIVSGLPYSATGKIAKERLRAMVRQSDLNLEPGRG